MNATAQMVEAEYRQRGDASEHWPSLSPRRILIGLCACIAALLCGYVATVAVRLTTAHRFFFGLVRLLDLDAEANIPTYFSVVQLNIAAYLLWMIGAHTRRRADPYSRHWLALGAIFVFLGLDELAQIHELLSQPFRVWLHADGMLHWAWVIPYGTMALAVGATYVGFLMHLPVRTRWLMVSSALIYIGGAAGLEMYGGYLESRLGAKATYTSLAYLTEVFFEEGMEMFGIALFIYTLLDHIQHTMGRVLIHVGSAQVPTPTQELNDTQALQILDSSRAAGERGKLAAP